MSLEQKAFASNVENVDEKEGAVEEHNIEVQPRRETHTVRGLKPRHAQMMAIAGAIGTGLFVSEPGTCIHLMTV